MNYLLTFLFPIGLMGAIQEKTAPRNDFFYTNLGGYYADFDAKGVDIGLGYRHIYGKSAFDINAGITWVDPGIPFVQGSYLFYPCEWNGPYLGAGISVVPLGFLHKDLSGLVNLPVIVGYQTSSKAHPVFIQFQHSVPYNDYSTIPGSTLSVGIGF